MCGCVIFDFSSAAPEVGDFVANHVSCFRSVQEMCVCVYMSEKNALTDTLIIPQPDQSLLSH